MGNFYATENLLGMQKIITVICVTYVQKDFKIGSIIDKIPIIFQEMPKILHHTHKLIFEV